MDGEWGTYDIAYEGKGGRAAGCIIVVEEETIRQGGIHSAHGMGGGRLYLVHIGSLDLRLFVPIHRPSCITHTHTLEPLTNPER